MNNDARHHVLYSFSAGFAPMATAVAPRVVFSSSIKMETVALADLKKPEEAGECAEPHSWTAAMHIFSRRRVSG